MSWKDAKNEADALIKKADFPADLNGREIDLNELAAKLPFEGQFRAMVLRAAARALKARGAKIRQ